MIKMNKKSKEKIQSHQQERKNIKFNKNKINNKKYQLPKNYHHQIKIRLIHNKETLKK
jgi:hypothetical protein